jgi:hypothetical protein
MAPAKMERSMESSRKMLCEGQHVSTTGRGLAIAGRWAKCFGALEIRAGRDMVYDRLWKLTFRATRPFTKLVMALPDRGKGIGCVPFMYTDCRRESLGGASMSLIHIGVALGLSAGAALVVTGAAMRPIEPSMAAGCMTSADAAVGDPACLTTGDIRLAGGAEGGSSLRLDTDRRDRDRHSHGWRRVPYPDCHRDVRTHFVPGYGVISHLHVGPDCKVRKAYKSGGG